MHYYHQHAMSAISVLLLGACTLTPGDTYRPPQMAQVLSNAGFTPLVLPDSKLAPGAVVEISRGTSGSPIVNYIGDFKQCGVPEAVLTITPGKAPPISFHKNLSSGGELSVSPTTLLGIEGVRIGPQFSSVETVTITINESGGDAIDRIRLGNWLVDKNNKDSIAGFCQRMLVQPNIYIISEAFHISKGRYDLFGANRQKLSLSGPDNPYIKLDADLSRAQVANGGVEFNQKYYVAVRNVSSLQAGVNENLSTSGAPVPVADPLFGEVVVQRRAPISTTFNR